MQEKVNIDRQLTNVELWWLILSTWYALNRLRQIELAPFNITVEQSTILVTLGYSDGSVTLKELEDITLRQQNSVSTLISRMKNNNLITKKKNPNTKKSEIMISRQGHDLLERITSHSMKEVFSHMTAAEKQELAGYLYSLRVRVRNLLGITYQPPFVRAMLGKKPSGEEEKINAKSGTVSDYNLWVFINGAGFAIYRSRQLELRAFDLTVEQSIILMLLQNGSDPITTKFIENVTLRQPTSISKLIRRMMHRGLVARSKDFSNRGYSFSLTDEGKILNDKLTNVSTEMVFSILTEDERQRLTDHLRTLNIKARGLLGNDKLLSTIGIVR